MTADSVQAFLYRGLTSALNIEKLIDEGALLEGPSGGVSIGRGPEVLSEFTMEARTKASRMGRIYELLYCLENSMRELIERTLKEVPELKESWTDGIKEGILKEARRRESQDEDTRWHGPRGQSVLNYLDFPQLGEIILDRWEDFQDLLGDRRWVEEYFREMNPTRRALAHTGDLREFDVERMEMRVREWLRVVG